MSRQVAHRPRYRSLHPTIHYPRNARQTFFRPRWTYRSVRAAYEKHHLGYRLSLIPLNYRFGSYIVLQRA